MGALVAAWIESDQGVSGSSPGTVYYCTVEGTSLENSERSSSGSGSWEIGPIDPALSALCEQSLEVAVEGAEEVAHRSDVGFRYRLR